MIRDDRPALSHQENWAALLAEHCFTAPPHAIGAAWVEWFAFLDRLRHRPSVVVIKPAAPAMALTIRRPTVSRCCEIEAGLTDGDREALRLARAHGRPWILGRDPKPYVYFPKGYC